MINKSIQFLKEVRLELSKVSYPNKPELVGSTIIVVVMSIIMAVFIGIVDFGLSQLTKLILR